MAVSGAEIVNSRTGQQIRFVQTARDSDGAVLELLCVSQPGQEREPEHIHPRQENIFEVHSGALHFHIDGAERLISAGERIVVPPGVPHRFWVEGDQEARYRQEFRPALNTEAFFEAFFRLAQDGKLNSKGLPNPLMLAVLGQAFWDEIRVTKPPAWLQWVLYLALAPLGRAIGYRAPTA
jgi:mannose-6-phosphate isomerase-like protein (cupin superfamily)